jgi:hypothetical protein
MSSTFAIRSGFSIQSILGHWEGQLLPKIGDSICRQVAFGFLFSAIGQPLMAD